MATQLTLTAQTPPALPPPAGLAQGIFRFDTRQVMLDTISSVERARVSRLPNAGGRTQVTRIGMEAARISIRASCYVPLWFAELTREQVERATDLIYPVNEWHARGNRVVFTGRGRSRIPPGSYVIMDITPTVERNIEGAGWVVRYSMEFEGGN